MTGSRKPCRHVVKAPGERCHWHGALSTGARTLTGKLRNGFRLKHYRITNGGLGKPKTSKAKRKREAAVVRMKAWRDREPIRRKKALKWANRQRIKSGLPLLTEAELEAMAEPTEQE